MVCAGEGIQTANVLDLLTRLVDQSLVVALHSEEGPVRYRLLETLRDYAEQRLTASGTRIRSTTATPRSSSSLPNARSRSCSALGGNSLNPPLNESRTTSGTALRWLVIRNDAERAQSLAGSVARFWFFHGYFDEGSTWLAQVLSLDGATRTAGRARSLHGAGTIAMMRGDVASAESALREALALWGELGNGTQQAFVLFVLGMVARQRADYLEAHHLFQQGWTPVGRLATRRRWPTTSQAWRTWRASRTVWWRRGGTRRKR